MPTKEVCLASLTLDNTNMKYAELDRKKYEINSKTAFEKYLGTWLGSPAVEADEKRYRALKQRKERESSVVSNFTLNTLQSFVVTSRKPSVRSAISVRL